MLLACHLLKSFIKIVFEPHHEKLYFGVVTRHTYGSREGTPKCPLSASVNKDLFVNSKTCFLATRLKIDTSSHSILGSTEIVFVVQCPSIKCRNKEKRSMIKALRKCKPQFYYVTYMSLNATKRPFGHMDIGVGKAKKK